MDDKPAAHPAIATWYARCADSCPIYRPRRRGYHTKLNRARSRPLIQAGVLHNVPETKRGKKNLTNSSYLDLNHVAPTGFEPALPP